MHTLEAPAITTWDTVIELSHVTKAFEQKQPSDNFWESLRRPKVKRVVALDDVSLTVKKGEFVAYAGPNGAGKSSTFKLLCGMLAPQQGTVRVFGLDPRTDRVALMKRVGLLFGGRSELWWDHPVIASFGWKKKVWQIPEETYARMLDWVCEVLDLKPLLHTFVRELSLGQRMRADLGMLLLHEPSLILLDEPTLGLDVLAKRRMIDCLKALNRDMGATLLVTSHDLDDLTEMARRLVMISEGRIAFDGTSSELRRATGEKRLLTLLCEGEAPVIPHATQVAQEEGRVTYAFDAQRVPMAELLAQVARMEGVLDVETGREPIEQVIARLYTHWRAEAKAAEAAR